jgi:excisionase family DNA binding protein
MQKSLSETEGIEQKPYLPRIMNVTELMEYLDIGRDRAYALVRQREFPSFKVGSEYKIVADKLPAWFEKVQRANK